MKADVLFCDDVRVEGNGKHILIGVYPVDIIPVGVPSAVTVSLWMRFSDLDAYPRRTRISVVPPGGVQPFETVIEGAPPGLDDPQMKMLVTLGGIPLQIETYGKISVLVGFDDSAPQEVASIDVNQRRV